MKNAGQLHGSLTVTNRFLELSCAIERKANLQRRRTAGSGNSGKML